MKSVLSFTLFAAALPAALPAQPAVSAPSPAAQEPLNLEPVVVTAAPSRQPLVVAADPRAPAQPVPAHDGADILKSIPGFSVVRKGGTDGDPVLRGLAGSRLGVQIDGESIYGGCGNRMDPPTAYVFPSAYDRVTVIKGPQTMLHGPGNAAGVVLFERVVHRLSAPDAALQIAATAASHGRFDGLVDGRAGSPLVQVRGTATHTRSDDYRDGEGRAVHSGYERWSANASLVWTPDDRTVLELSGARSDGEAAYADRLMDGVKFARANYGIRFHRENLNPLVTRIEARFYHNYVDHVMDNYTLRPFMAMVGMANPAVSNPDRLTTGVLAQLTLSPLETLSLATGVDFQRNAHTIRSTSNQTAAPYETKARVRDAEFTQSGFFAEGTGTVAPGRRVVAGARLDRWEAEDSRRTVAIAMMTPVGNPSAGRVRQTHLLSGFVRYEHELGGNRDALTLFAGLGCVQRFPDYWELIKNESAASVTAFGTRSETTTQFDAGAIGRRGPFDFSISVFAADVADYILVQSNVAKSAGPMGSRNAVITRNVAASTRGGEAAVTWRMAEHWRWDASLACVRGENDTDSIPLAQLPPLEARLGVAYAAKDWSVGGLLRAVAAQDRFAPSQGNIVGQDIGRSPGFVVASLNASRRFGRHGRLSVGIDNLFDRTYAEHISRAGSAVSGFVQTTRVNEPGRLGWLKLDLSL
jgi:iron complex outermembrane receptor protein